MMNRIQGDWALSRCIAGEIDKNSGGFWFVALSLKTGNERLKGRMSFLSCCKVTTCKITLCRFFNVTDRGEAVKKPARLMALLPADEGL
jgi:hypothetical protein